MKPKYTIALIIILLFLTLIPLFTFRESAKGKKKKGKKGKKGKKKGPSGPKNTRNKTGAATGVSAAALAAAATDQEITKCNALLSKNGVNANSSDSLADSAAGTDSNYSYINFIKTPKELKMSDKGTIKTLERDINGIKSYVELLTTGTSSASKSKNPLGNKFFVRTAGKCNSIDKSTNGIIKDRYFYVNNVPLGKLPMGSPGVVTKDFRGLIPGMMQNIGVINPGNIIDAFYAKSTPDCMSVTLDTIDSNGKVGSATHYVAVTDIMELDPCLFPKNSKKVQMNPLTKVKCTEGFQSISENENEVEEEESDDLDLIQENIRKDYISQLFLTSVGIFGIYILFMAMKKMK